MLSSPDEIDPEFLVEQLLNMAGLPPLNDHLPIAEKRDRAMSLLRQEWNDLREELRKFRAIPVPTATDRSQIQRTIRETLNICLQVLQAEAMNSSFASVVFPPEALRTRETLRSTVERLRVLCMYYRGSFGAAYVALATGLTEKQTIEQHWKELFQSNEKSLAEALMNRARLHIHKVKGHNLWVLGYVAEAQAPAINEARKELEPYLREALNRGVKDLDGLKRIISKASKGTKSAESLIKKAGLKAELHRTGDMPRYEERLTRAIEECEEVTPEKIKELKAQGRMNTTVYLATAELDVYVATSMRDPADFATQASLVERLFEEGELHDLGIRFFDPTQAFSHDRIDKGVMENLMIMRSKVVLYNAQESDTFGKDSEIAAGLALRKHAVVYVARLFHEDDPPFKRVYDFIDDNRGRNKPELIKNALQPPLNWDFNREQELWKAANEGDVIATIVRVMLEKALEKKNTAEILSELKRHGYDFVPEDGAVSEEVYLNQLRVFTLERIAKLEGRAFVFSELHPLSLQVSPFDGVARGVVVTRTIAQTRKVIKALLLGTMKYHIDPRERCYVLRDDITKSPVRVVTKDEELTKAFWTTFDRLEVGA